MTLDEANEKCKQLTQLNIDIWNARSSAAKDGLRTAFKTIYRDILNAKFKVRKWKEYTKEGTKPMFKAVDDGTREMLAIVNNRPTEGWHKGDCTTRSICFCTGADYNEIYSEQEFYARKSSYGTWRTPSVWKQCFYKRGYCDIKLPRKVARKTFIKLFKNSSINEGIIATTSSRHIAAIDMKEKKILDLFNSSGDRIYEIIVPVKQKEEYEKEIKRIFKK